MIVITLTALAFAWYALYRGQTHATAGEYELSVTWSKISIGLSGIAFLFCLVSVFLTP